ncbi:hypothetical protein BD414DRAFT_495746 [Trametes punicea]|nr:hypothetical protein BD414DRAFT_495746 [Trametes punicea]
MAPPTNVTFQYEPTPDEKTIEDAAKLYVELFEDDPSLVGVTSGRLDLALLMTKGVLRALSFISGELYTARDENSDLVGFTAWTPPGRSCFDTPDQFELGFGEFLNSLDQEGRDFQHRMFREVLPEFADNAIGIEKAELNCYWCWFAMVRKDYHGKGICRALFNLVYEKAKEKGATMALITQHSVNVGKYERLGLGKYGQQNFEYHGTEWTYYCMARKTDRE